MRLLTLLKLLDKASLATAQRWSASRSAGAWALHLAVLDLMGEVEDALMEVAA